MNFAKFARDTSESFVIFIVDGVDLLVEAFMKKKSRNKFCR